MAINGKPRIVVWVVSNDNRFIGGALNILERQFNGVELVGVTANVKIVATDNHGRAVSFIPLQELSGNGGGMIFFLLPARKKSACRKLQNLPNP